MRCLLVILLFPAMNFAQVTPSGLLKRVKQTYAPAQQYQFTTRMVERRSGIETTSSEEIAVDKRGRVWFKAVGSAASGWSKGREDRVLIIVADGRQVWVYLEQQKMYKRTDGNPEPREADTDDANIDTPRSIAREVMDAEFRRYSKFEAMSNHAKIVREEGCSANGVRSRCYVVEIDAETTSPRDVTGLYTLWIDKLRYLVLREDLKVVDKSAGIYTNSMFHDVAKVNTEVPANIFSFTPPSDTKEVISFFQ